MLCLLLIGKDVDVFFQFQQFLANVSEKLTEMSEDDEALVLLSFLTMTLLERARG